jgi:xanthine dehydrogenase small subunit
MISYWKNGSIEQDVSVSNTQTLLQFLRESKRLTGTKEGCASGDCGACTVVLVSLSANETLDYEAVNSCLMPLADLAGKALITIEDLAEGNALHPLQQAFIDHHASQCGFCTPGFILSALALKKRESNPDIESIDEALGGNLCRCTGYSPIVKAVQLADCNQDRFSRLEKDLIRSLKQLQNLAVSIPGYHQPRSLKELCLLKQEYPDSILLSGGTDWMLRATQNLEGADTLISTERVSELQALAVKGGDWSIGAGVSLSRIKEQAKAAGFNALNHLLDRFASQQIRNRATLGGSIGNASPIGDLAPLMLALDAQLALISYEQQRLVAINQFFLGYKQTELDSSEVISQINFKIDDQAFVYFDKVSKRLDDDISAVAVATHFTLKEGRLTSLRVGLGGMAATPVLAQGVMSRFEGVEPSSISLDQVAQALDELKPLSDLRATADYRLRVCAGLIHNHLTRAEASV